MSPLIVVVDNDGALCSIFTSRAFQKTRWKVICYSYTEITLTTIQDQNPDLIILDFPNKSAGKEWELLQLLKMEEITASTPIIVYGAKQSMSLEVAGYLASRHIRVVSKAGTLEKFVSVIRQALMVQTIFVLSINKHLPILLVDDNADLSEEFLTILQMEGYLAVWVSNGQLALDAVKVGQYSLIFLDMDMPVMTGPEFIAAYALLPGPHTPVVIFSAQTDHLSIELFPPFVLGHLPKPFQIEELLMFVTRFTQPV